MHREANCIGAHVWDATVESPAMKPDVDQLLAPKPEINPRTKAYAIEDKAHAGLLKIGQTTRDVKQRVAEQLKTAAIKKYKIVLDEAATRDDGSVFSDFQVREALKRKGLRALSSSG